MKLGLPIVVALTKVDVAAAEGNPVDVDNLQRALGLPLVPVDGRLGHGVAELRTTCWRSDAALLSRPDSRGPPRPGQPPARPCNAPIAHRSHRRLCCCIRCSARSYCWRARARHVPAGVHASPSRSWPWIEGARTWSATTSARLVAAGAVRSFLVDGLVNGVGSSLVFVPQIALLIAFVTMRRGLGLHGARGVPARPAAAPRSACRARASCR
jgi:ferrous iron transport protein B